MPESPLLGALSRLLEQKPDAKILDIGGCFAPCRSATHMVDIMPFEKLNLKGAYGPAPLKITKSNYVEMDLGSGAPLPFADKAFDFVVCRHTLEDIANPLFVCAEINRVSKAGYIETPSRIYESTRGVERPSWAGHYHHRWFVEVEGNKLIFQFKPHNLHSRAQFYFWCPPWRKVREEFKNTWLLWTSSFDFQERVIIEYKDVQSDLRNFKLKNRKQALLRWRWQRS